MAGVQNTVELLFQVSDQATGPSRNIASSFDGLKSVALAAGAAVAAVGAGVLAVAKQAVELGSKFEDTSINIAGNIRAFDLAPTFDAATKSAANALDTIEAMAAKLPGETDQYVEVFKIALPKAIESGMSDIKAITDLTSRFTAVAVSGGVDAGQAGMDMFRMLAGQAGADVKMFTMLAPHLKMTAQQFNKLTAEARRLALDKSLGNFKEMMEAAGNTFSSKMGEAQSHIKTFIRLAGEPIFDAAVKALSAFNQYFSDNEKTLREIGKTVTTALVDGLRTTVDLMRDMYSIGKDVAGVFGTIYDRGSFFFDALAKALPMVQAISGGKVALGAVGDFYANRRQELEQSKRVPLSPEAAGQMELIHFREMELSKSLFGAAESLHGFESLAVDSQQEILRRIGETYPAGSAPFREAFESHVKALGYDVAGLVPEAKAGKPTIPGGPKKADVVIENARFDIKQNFAEGYDPDRIAAAFVDQLGSATMYRTQSAFSGQPGTGG